MNVSGGHHYLNLIERDEQEGIIIAQTNAILWGERHRKLKKKLGRKLDFLLQEGQQILIKVIPDYHERYGLKLSIVEFNENFTDGQLAMRKQEIISRLKEEGLFSKNKTIALPDVLQRIAVIGSRKSAGYQDFDRQLKDNPFGYRFSARLFNANVQGEQAEKTLLTSLQTIEKRSQDFDCMVMIRGGGAKTDLLAFDHYELAKTVANSSLPVFTGIGHDIDESIVDMLASEALKTPTAAADFILNHNLIFESGLQDIALQLERLSMHALTVEKNKITAAAKFLFYESNNYVQQKKQTLGFDEKQLKQITAQKFKELESKLDKAEEICQLANPEHLLKKGFCLIRKNNTVVKNASDLTKSDIVEIQLPDGFVQGKIIKEKYEK